MTKSKLENIGNVQLFYFIKSIGNTYSVSDIIKNSEVMEDNDFIDACYDSARIMSLDLDFPEDFNYIASVVKLNKTFDFTTQRPQGTLSRPTAKKFRFDIDESRTEYVTRTYRNNVTSYSGELVLTTIRSLHDSGFDYWGGDMVGEDFYNGETTDVKIDKTSIERID